MTDPVFRNSRREAGIVLVVRGVSVICPRMAADDELDRGGTPDA